MKYLPQHPVRSKGQATIQADGDVVFPSTVRDIYPSGIGVLAPQQLSPGTFVHVDIHGHGADGVVHRCDPQDSGFYLGITLNNESPASELPAA